MRLFLSCVKEPPLSKNIAAINQHIFFINLTDEPSQLIGKTSPETDLEATLSL